MESRVPYSKEIKFTSTIAEICSISLEHELVIGEEEISGNFILSGEYKSHEISVNKEKFNYKLPFSIDSTNSIIKDSIEFEITDFTYEIIDNDTLKVNIEFLIKADEEVIEDVLKVEDEDDDEEFRKELNDIFLNDEEEEKEVEEDNILINELDENEEIIDNEERLDKESENLVLSSANDKEDEFTTYNIHIVKNGDTIETICTMYQTDINTLKNYNNIENITVGNKIIIPSLDE